MQLTLNQDIDHVCLTLTLDKMNHFVEGAEVAPLLDKALRFVARGELSIKQ
jgi:hypothetical protein